MCCYYLFIIHLFLFCLIFQETWFGSCCKMYQQEKLGQITVSAWQRNQNIKGTRVILTFSDIQCHPLSVCAALTCFSLFQELKHENIVRLLDYQVNVVCCFSSFRLILNNHTCNTADFASTCGHNIITSRARAVQIWLPDAVVFMAANSMTWSAAGVFSELFSKGEMFNRFLASDIKSCDGSL